MNTTTRKTTAAESYAAEQKRIADAIERIQARLHAHADKASGAPLNWGFAGDLAHVRELLEQADNFLAGN